MRGERVKSPKVLGWVDTRAQKKPYRINDEGAARYKLSAYFEAHLGEWLTRKELGAVVGRKTSNVDSLLADMENASTPVVLIHDEDTKQARVMAIPRGRAAFKEYFGE